MIPMTEGQTPQIVYSAESQAKSPGKLFRGIAQDVFTSRELAWRLFIRDIKAQYRQSLLGVIWAFVPPLVTGLIFIVLQQNNVVNLGETAIPYPVYVLTGTILWQVFTDSLNTPLRSVKNAQSMLTRINFPREALILSGIYVVIFNLLIKLVVLLAIFLFFRVPLTLGILAAGVPTGLLIMLGIGFGLLLVPIGTLYTDVTAALPTLTQIWFFLTPVVYATPQTPPLSTLALINPVSPLLGAARSLATASPVMNMGAVYVASVVAIIAFFFGLIVYRVGLPIVIERMSS
jgi:lipopolysaccharide transport system permease protein